MRVRSGLENFIASPPSWVQGRRLGLLCNPASVNAELRHARDLIARKLPGSLTALYSPQHGFYAEKQDNMIASDDMTDPVLNIPVFSLYGTTRIPTKRMFDPIDILIIDLQDAGTRVYTFIYTMAYCLEAAQKYGKKVIVLDRPNPINGTVIEGNCLVPEYASFVGRYPIPMRHGLTIGELALLFNTHFHIHCELEVMALCGWNRKMYFADTGLPWIPPSPNLPTLSSAMVYPGQVIWEGTNISEGRGTTQPFELCGAPFIDTKLILAALSQYEIPGVFFRSVIFEPTSNKWKDQQCCGFQLHVTEPSAFQPYVTSLRLLQAIINHHGEYFQWKSPPYEYEYDRFPIDLIIGDKQIRRCIENFDNLDEIVRTWQPSMNEFKEISRQFYLYS
jgi:uncharacterized protein YbbC (DUF1343 family)